MKGNKEMIVKCECKNNWRHMLIWDRMPNSLEMIKPEWREELYVLGFATRKEEARK